MMLLLPSEQSEAQARAIRLFLDCRDVRLYEPCDCGSQIRHNNGGNYHCILGFRMDAGEIYRAQTFTGDYGPPFDWGPVKFSEAIDEIAQRARDGWDVEGRK